MEVFIVRLYKTPIVLLGWGHPVSHCSWWGLFRSDQCPSSAFNLDKVWSREEFLLFETAPRLRKAKNFAAPWIRRKLKQKIARQNGGPFLQLRSQRKWEKEREGEGRRDRGGRRGRFRKERASARVRLRSSRDFSASLRSPASSPPQTSTPPDLSSSSASSSAATKKPKQFFHAFKWINFEHNLSDLPNRQT